MASGATIGRLLRANHITTHAVAYVIAISLTCFKTKVFQNAAFLKCTRRLPPQRTCVKLPLDSIDGRVVESTHLRGTHNTAVVVRTQKQRI
jgi:hypothetical protein